MLQSPTTTDADRRVAEALIKISGLDLNDFGLTVLRKNDRLLVDDPETLVRVDQKGYQHNSVSILASSL